MKKVIGLVIVCFLAYNSVYFKKLSEQSASESSKFNFVAYADSIYNQGILKQAKPISLADLQKELGKNTENAFSQFGNRLGIGQTAYFMVSVDGTVLNKIVDGFEVKTADGNVYPIDTKFIFGNAIRDASKLVKLTDFKTNADFNKVSEELNNVIREKAIPAQLSTLTVGDKVEVVGAIKQSKKDALPILILPANITKL
jgi:predicted lipoprotein